MDEELAKKVKETKWGFLRETSELATEAGIDKDTGLFRTGLEVYLKKIFPDTHDWIHDKIIPEAKRRLRPDYRSESLKLIVEFDGLPHYLRPDAVQKDVNSASFYRSLGYTVVRIPYFIQFTNKVIKTMFGVDIEEPMFVEEIPSLGMKGCNTPAYLCGAGIERMAEEFKKYPEQYKVNVGFLESQNNEYLTGVGLLKMMYQNIKKD